MLSIVRKGPVSAAVQGVWVASFSFLAAACPSNLWGNDSVEGVENVAQTTFVNSLLAEMTLEEKIGQLVIRRCRYRGILATKASCWDDSKRGV